MLTQDIRYALRTLVYAPTFSLAAVLTIALGIAANASVFSIVNAALIRSLPFPEPDGLMQVAERNEKLRIPYLVASPLNYLSWKELTRTLQLGAFGFGTYSLTGGASRSRWPAGRSPLRSFHCSACGPLPAGRSPRARTRRALRRWC